MARYFGTNIISGDINGLTNAQYNAINSGITAAKVDDTVYKSTAQTITGEKTFAGGQVTKFKDNSNTIGTFSSNTWSTSNLYFSDSTGARIARIQPAYIIGTNILQMGMYASNNTTSEQGITVRNDGITSAPTPANSSSTSETKIATTGWVNNSTASTNVVHRDSAETISGNKTFSGTNTFSGSNTFSSTVSLGSSATATTPANTDNSTAVATTAFVRNRESDIVHKSGTETITGAKTYSDTITSSKVTSTYLAGNQGAAIINSTSSAGAYTMLAKMNSTNGYMTIGTYQGKFELHYTAKTTVDAGTNTYTYQATLLDESGNATFPGIIYGTANRALYADLAENYQSDEKYSIGTLIKFGGEKDITIANDKCNGVISDKPGLLLDDKLEDSQPIALVGKTPIRIIGKVNKFDNITLSEIPGIGRVAKEGENIIAKALESSDIEEEKLILCVTKFSLD